MYDHRMKMFDYTITTTLSKYYRGVNAHYIDDCIRFYAVSGHVIPFKKYK